MTRVFFFLIKIYMVALVRTASAYNKLLYQDHPKFRPRLYKEPCLQGMIYFFLSTLMSLWVIPYSDTAKCSLYTGILPYFLHHSTKACDTTIFLYTVRSGLKEALKQHCCQMVEKWTGIFITLLMKFTEAIQSSSYITNQFSNTLHQSSSNTFSFYNHQYTHIQTYSFQPQLFHNNWML